MILRMHFLCTCNGTHAERYISRGKFCYSQMTTHFIKHSWFLPCCSNPISSLSLWKKSVNAITMFVLTTLALLPLIVRWLLLIYRKVQTSQASAYVNREIPDVQAGFRKGRGTRDQIANIRWIMEKAREFQKNIYFCFIDYAKAFGCVDHNKLENTGRDGNTRSPDLPSEKSVCRSGSNS